MCASLTRIFASTNKGETWTTLPEVPGGRVVMVKSTERGALAAGSTGVFSWTAAKPRWIKVATPDPVTVRDLFTGSGDFAALAVKRGLLISDDAGRTWRACSGLPDLGDLHYVAGIGGQNGFLLAGSSLGLMRSDDGCRTWTPVRQGLSGDTVSLVAIERAQSPLAFVVQYGRAFVSSDRGRSWKPLHDEGRFGSFPVALRVVAGAAGPRLFALFSGRGVMVQDLTMAELPGNSALSRLLYPFEIRKGDSGK